MNSSKNNIEDHIKKQISEREITPSRDLWSEIQAHQPAEYSGKKVNWFLVAACLVLAFSLSMVLFFNKENPQNLKSNIAVGDKKEENKESESVIVKTQTLSQKKKVESVAIENAALEETKKTADLQIDAKEKQLPLPMEKAPEMMANISSVEPEKIIAQSDSAKTPARRKRYVDPSTLLFSVEHKDVIEKTKGKSNVASIDLNEK
ncbi:hypothetical protein [Chryseobacterium cheonjiense]|uniref:Uncharacterized protein n=1 Tax=Chryseobacterium cheonjiense TaxID=2728845 RepID=A0A7Y0A855_9FLAO|nr:hypothetical protein [Chryseobacterium cheonjiense]NML58477.1 hypothetical protein [Chryseobacterium cheonjiense]